MPLVLPHLCVQAIVMRDRETDRSEEGFGRPLADLTKIPRPPSPCPSIA